MYYLGMIVFSLGNFDKETLVKKIREGETCLLEDNGETIAEILPTTESHKMLRREVKMITPKPGKSTTEMLREERDSKLNYYFDSSALEKRYINESGSLEV